MLLPQVKQKNCLTGFILIENVIRCRIESVCITILANASPLVSMKLRLETYKEMVDDITRFLNGGYKKVKKELTEKMSAAAENLEFERAKEYRDQIANIEAVMEKQAMTMNDFTDRDIFGFAVDNGWMCVQVFFVRQGKLIERDVSLFPLYQEPEEELLTFIGQFYGKSNI